MKEKSEDIDELYELAREDACNTDCPRFCSGTCIAEPGNKMTCPRFRTEYNILLEMLKRSECQECHFVSICSECEEYWQCDER